MSQPQYSRPDDGSKASPVGEEFQGTTISNPDDHTKGEDHSHEKKSLISVVKNKAKDKMHKARDKLKTKLTKDKDADNIEDEEDLHDVQVKSKNLLETPTHGYAADGSYVNHGKPLGSFGVRSTRDQHGNSSPSHEQGQEEYDSFLKSTEGETEVNSDDLMSVPTDYSSPRAVVDAVMPPPVISRGSASDVGEQSSSSLGNIPERPKEEDKMSATETPDEKSRSSSSFASFGDTTQDKLTHSDKQKGLEAIERDSMSQELGEGSKESKFEKNDLGQVKEEPREENQLSFNRKSDRELPSHEAPVPLMEPEKGGSQGEADRSTENADEAHDALRESEKQGIEGESDRSTGKADCELRSKEASVTSRGSDGGSERPLRDPDVKMPVPQGADFTDSMFSSHDADDLHDTANSSGRKESEESHSPAVSSRNLVHQEGIVNPSNSTQADKVQEEREEEQFFDPQVDEFSLEKQASRSVDTHENREEKGKFTQDAFLDLDDKEQEDEGSKSETGLLSSVTYGFKSAAEGFGTKVGYSKSHEPTASGTETSKGGQDSTSGETAPDREPAEQQDKSWAQWATEKTKKALPPLTPQNSTVEPADPEAGSMPQSWISKAIGVLSTQSNNKEDKIDEVAEEQDEDSSSLKTAKKKGVDTQASGDTQQALVR